jgi:hypothetical protein
MTELQVSLSNEPNWVRSFHPTPHEGNGPSPRHVLVWNGECPMNIRASTSSPADVINFPSSSGCTLWKWWPESKQQACNTIGPGWSHRLWQALTGQDTYISGSEYTPQQSGDRRVNLVCVGENPYIINAPKKEVKVKKVKLFLCFSNKTLCHAGVWASGWTDPHFLSSALVGGEWSASNSARFTPGEKAPVTHWIDRGWMSSRSGLDNVEERKFLPLQGLEHRPLGRPARSQSL